MIISQNIFPAVLAPITTRRSASATIRLDSISSVCSTLIIIILLVIIVVLLLVGLVYVVVIIVVVIVVDVVIIIIVDVISLVDADIRPRGGRSSCSSKDPVIAQPEEVLGERGVEEEENAVEHYKVSCLHSWVAGTTQHITALYSSVQTSRTTASTDWLHWHWVAYKVPSSPQHRWRPGTPPEKVAAGRK